MKYLLYLHIASGFISLLAFWAPIFTAKGKKVHRTIGFIYVYAMWIVVFTAAILSVNNLVIGELYMGLFLGFLSIISANPLWHGIAVLRNKKVQTKQFQILQYVLTSVQIVFGAFLFVFGSFFVEEGVRILMMFFGFLGLSSVRELIALIKSDNTSKTDWYKAHYTGMITTGIAAYTAFLAFGGRQFLSGILPGMWQVLPWILPTVIGFIAIRMLERSRSKSTAAETQGTT